MFGTVKKWVKEHYKGIAITVGIVAVVGGVAILLINGKKVKVPIAEMAGEFLPEAPAALVKEASEIAIQTNEGIMTFPRSEFIRHLHEGWRASEAKIKQAAELGINLLPGETFVNPCMVTRRVA